MNNYSDHDSFARTSNSPIGCVEVQANSNGLTQITLAGRNNVGNLVEDKFTQSLAEIALKQILEYLDGKRSNFDLPIDWSMMKPFQQKVLRLAMEIPFAEVRTYGQLAKELKNPAASRAVGGALAHNPLPIVIPCHRVVAADGRLTGFSAADGIKTKCWLLELEGHSVVGEKLG